MSKHLLALVIAAFSLSACGDDDEGRTNRGVNSTYDGVSIDGTAWVRGTDPITGTELSCFVVDGGTTTVMYCIEVP